MKFIYGEDVFEPEVKNRNINFIKKSLKNMDADEPEIVCSIAMYIGNKIDKDDFLKRNLLYVAVIYSKGKLGEETVRSQDHIHGVLEIICLIMMK